ncbi:MAG TPA: hypothetical protein VNO82_14690, partial [Solirubrobacteraceae bacterium]|nr:hypothetical protein [Solirubrobacteraceae bacterium]
APDGWAIVAHGRAERQPPSVFERAPGASFTPVTLPEAPGPRRVIRDAKVAIRSGGGAIVAWRRGKFGSLSGVDAMVRESAGPFTARRVAEPREPIAVGGELTLDFIDVLDAPPIDFDGASLDVALTADRVLLAWPAPAGRAPLAVLGVRAAFGRLDGTFEPVQDLGTTARDVHDLAAQFTADGRGAVVWTDHTTYPGRGRLHTALEGAAATSPPAPGLRVVAKEHQRLYPSEPVRVLVVCDAACDLRTAVGGIGPRSFSRGAGTHTIPVGPAAGFRPGATQRVRVLVQASAPGGEQTTARTRRVTVTTLRSPPLREPLQVKARRAGDDIVVTWRTAKPARRQRIFVIGNNFRAADGGFDPTAYEPVNGGGRRRFRVRLRPADPDLIRSVTVLVEGYDSGEDGPVKTVRVRSPRA